MDDKQNVVHMARRLREEREQVVHSKPDTNTISIAVRDSSYSAEDEKSAATIFEEFAHRPFSGTLVRSNLCAFVAGRPGDLSQVEVTVSSVLQFIPGVRVAVAAMDDSLDAYERCVFTALSRLFPTRHGLNTCLRQNAPRYALKYRLRALLLHYVMRASQETKQSL